MSRVRYVFCVLANKDRKSLIIVMKGRLSKVGVLCEARLVLAVSHVVTVICRGIASVDANLHLRDVANSANLMRE